MRGLGGLICLRWADASLGYPRCPVVLAIESPLGSPVAFFTELSGRHLSRHDLGDVG